MPSYILAHDIGTSGNKAALFDEHGALVSSTTVPYATYIADSVCIEQSAGDWWKAVSLATKQVLQGIAPSDVVAIGVSGQMIACLPVDRLGNPLHNAIIWSDTRAVQEAEALRAAFGEPTLYHITGQPVSPNYVLPKIMWFKAHYPQLYKETFCFLQSKDFVNARLTGGVIKTDPTDAAYTLAYDIGRGCWSEQILSFAEISKDKFPEVVPCGTIIGKVCKKAADACGLPAGIPVIETAGDGSAAHLGAGNTKSGDTYICLGSSTWIVTATQSLIFDKNNLMQSEPHVIPSLHAYLGTMQTGGLAYSWFRDTIGRGMSFEEINKLAMNVVPGSNGTIFLPYISGERSPWYDHRINGSFLGLRQNCGLGEMARAVLEGVAFNLKLILDTIEKDIVVEEITLIGGGGKSPLWQQILADITEKPLCVLENLDEGTSFGAALIAGVGIGLFPDFSVTSRLLKMKNRVDPRQETFSLYRQEKEIFYDSYAQMKSLNDRLYACKMGF